ncbi:uroporphyrinogen-III synthase-like [Cylas formicarius]|uniref:uroporphyrinogen-III synthase-like n=1 Tax=Cylas formicarius TaxID=197179 RepID=UPI002958DA6A|nr:uroporphyrinogen-III synthase-like [Cylas formicarius]
MTAKNCVLLLKSTSSDGEDKYKKLLHQNNFNVECVNTLTFQFKNISALSEKLKAPENYEGVLLSSPRCVSALQQASYNNVLDKWKGKHNFAVGETTWKIALEQLGLDCKGKDSGSAIKLTEVILKEKSQYKNLFLLPHGNLATDTLTLELQKAGLVLDTIEIYDTLPNPNIEPELFNATDGFKCIPEYIVFFSPSGVSTTISFIEMFKDNFGAIKFIAIGQTTKAALEQLNLTVYGVPKQPNPQELLNVILNK